MKAQAQSPAPGASPARVVAHIRMKLGGANLPKFLAEALAAAGIMPDNLTPEIIEKIAALVAAMPPGVDTDEARRALSEAVVALIGGDEHAAPPPEAEAKSVLSLVMMNNGSLEDVERFLEQPNSLASAVAHYRGKGESVPRGGVGPAVIGRAHSGVSLAAQMADGLAARLDARHKPTVGAAFARMEMAEMAMTAARARGHRPSNAMEAVRLATHTTSDFPLAMGGALEIVVGRGVASAPTALLRATHEIRASDYKSGNVISLDASSVPEEVGESGEIRHVTIDERGEAKPVPRDVGALFRLSNKAIVNDQVGILADIAKPMILGSREKQRRILVEPLSANSGAGQTMRDGNPVFHSSHGNLASSGAALTVESLTAARLALRSQRGSQGDYLNIEPWALVVPPQLETVAQQLLAAINPAASSDVNPFAGRLELIVEVGLPSATAWYLIGNPSEVDGLAHSYLDGQSGPRVETKPGWETLGMEFRLTWALDVKFVEWRTWYRNPGA